jgi:hypothetical protein
MEERAVRRVKTISAIADFIPNPYTLLSALCS